MNHLGNGHFQAFSAGSVPAGFVHPQAIACLNRNRVPVQHPNSKSWDEFTGTPLDLVVTVCGDAAGEVCPVFPGAPVRAHWGVADPALATGSPAEIAAEFQRVFEQLRGHIEQFVAVSAAIPPGDSVALERAITKLGAPA